uniref:RdRp n=1 Tax=Beihai hepe-like virus 2 TaxID=1922383 RepID=A0A1L3KJF4_9VIRU|nr:RdRp [Beihai hepe-like virus 2]
MADIFREEILEVERNWIKNQTTQRTLASIPLSFNITPDEVVQAHELYGVYVEPNFTAPLRNHGVVAVGNHLCELRMENKVQNVDKYIEIGPNSSKLENIPENAHYCLKLDGRDQARILKSPYSKKEVLAGGGNTPKICTNGAESCHVKSKIAIANSSIYDISAQQMLEIFENHHLQILHASIISPQYFHDGIEGKDPSGLFYIKEWGKKLIMNFPGSEHGYIHEKSNWKTWCVSSVIKGSKFDLLIERHSKVGIYDIISITRTTLGATIPTLHVPNSEYVTIFDITSLNARDIEDIARNPHSKYSQLAISKMKKIRILKSTHSKVLSNALTREDTHFRRQQIVSNLKAYMSSIVISTTVVNKGQDFTSDEFAALGINLYLEACILRQISTKYIAKVIDEMKVDMENIGIFKQFKIWLDHLLFSGDKIVKTSVENFRAVLTAKQAELQWRISALNVHREVYAHDDQVVEWQPYVSEGKCLQESLAMMINGDTAYAYKYEDMQINQARNAYPDLFVIEDVVPGKITIANNHAQPTISDLTHCEHARAFTRGARSGSSYISDTTEYDKWEKSRWTRDVHRHPTEHKAQLAQYLLGKRVFIACCPPGHDLNVWNSQSIYNQMAIYDSSYVKLFAGRKTYNKNVTCFDCINKYKNVYADLGHSGTPEEIVSTTFSALKTLQDKNFVLKMQKGWYCLTHRVAGNLALRDELKKYNIYYFKENPNELFISNQNIHDHHWALRNLVRKIPDILTFKLPAVKYEPKELTTPVPSAPPEPIEIVLDIHCQDHIIKAHTTYKCGKLTIGNKTNTDIFIYHSTYKYKSGLSFYKGVSIYNGYSSPVYLEVEFIQAYTDTLYNIQPNTTNTNAGITVKNISNNIICQYHGPSTSEYIQPGIHKHDTHTYTNPGEAEQGHCSSDCYHHHLCYKAHKLQPKQTTQCGAMTFTNTRKKSVYIRHGKGMAIPGYNTRSVKGVIFQNSKCAIRMNIAQVDKKKYYNNEYSKLNYSAGLVEKERVLFGKQKHQQAKDLNTPLHKAISNILQTPVPSPPIQNSPVATNLSTPNYTPPSSIHSSTVSQTPSNISGSSTPTSDSDQSQAIALSPKLPAGMDVTDLTPVPTDFVDLNDVVDHKFTYLYLDFEATCDDKFIVQEIIEFPVIGYQDQKEVFRFHAYVKPKRSRVTPYCTNLTGITQQKVDQCEEFIVVYDAFLEWFKQHVKGDFLFITCGDWDLNKMLPSQLIYYKRSIDPIFRKYKNLKHIFRDQFKFKKTVDMMQMLQYLNIAHYGVHHSGIDDCVNIAAIHNKLQSFDQVMYGNFFKENVVVLKHGSPNIKKVVQHDNNTALFHLYANRWTDVMKLIPQGSNLTRQSVQMAIRNYLGCIPPFIDIPIKTYTRPCEACSVLTFFDCDYPFQDGNIACGELKGYKIPPPGEQINEFSTEFVSKMLTSLKRELKQDTSPQYAELNNNAYHEIETLPRCGFKKKISGWIGCPGSGKSTTVRQHFKPDEVLIITPYKRLAKDYRESKEAKYQAVTFIKALTIDLSDRHVVLDEVFAMSPGIVIAFLIKAQKVTIIGDPRQMAHVDEHGIYGGLATKDVLQYDQLSELNISFTLPLDITMWLSKLGYDKIKTRNRVISSIHRCNTFAAKDEVLCFTTRMESMHPDYTTVAKVQGMRADQIRLLIESNAHALIKNAHGQLVVAISRHSKQLKLHAHNETLKMCKMPILPDKHTCDVYGVAQFDKDYLTGSEYYFMPKLDTAMLKQRAPNEQIKATTKKELQREQKAAELSIEACGVQVKRITSEESEEKVNVTTIPHNLQSAMSLAGIHPFDVSTGVEKNEEIVVQRDFDVDHYDPSVDEINDIMQKISPNTNLDNDLGGVYMHKLPKPDHKLVISGNAELVTPQDRKVRKLRMPLRGRPFYADSDLQQLHTMIERCGKDRRYFTRSRAKKEGKKLWKNFREKILTEPLEQVTEEQISLSIGEMLNKAHQKGELVQFTSYDPGIYQDSRKINCFLKQQIKADPSAQSYLRMSEKRHGDVRAKGGQGISAQPTIVNLMIGGAVRAVLKNIFKALPAHILIGFGASKHKINDLIEKILKDIKNYNGAEVDIAQFDEQRSDWTDEYMDRVYYAGGLNKTLLAFMINLNLGWILDARVLKMWVKGHFQSGRCDTLGSNTLVALAFLATYFEWEDLALILAQGDDLAIIAKKIKKVTDLPFFKVVHTKFPTFTGSILAGKLLPDIPRLIIKLGNRPFANEKDLQDYREGVMQWLETMVTDVDHLVTIRAVACRYGITEDEASMLTSFLLAFAKRRIVKSFNDPMLQTVIQHPIEYAA